MVQAYIFSLLSFSLYFQSSNSISDSISFLFSSFQFHTHARGARDLIFFLQRYDVFLQVACVFSKFRPRACTYRLDPDSCRLAYGTAPFGPIECKQLLLLCLVSLCIQDAPLRIWLVLTHFFFRDKGEDRATPSESLWTLQIQLSRGAFSSPRYFAIFLQCAVTENLNQVYNL